MVADGGARSDVRVTQVSGTLDAFRATRQGGEPDG
jgi:hypothetical protein